MKSSRKGQLYDKSNRSFCMNDAHGSHGKKSLMEKMRYYDRARLIRVPRPEWTVPRGSQIVIGGYCRQLQPSPQRGLIT